MTNYSRSVLKSNGFHHPENRLKKFEVSLKSLPRISPKSYRHRLYLEPLLIAFFNFSHKRPRSLSHLKPSTHSALCEKSHTRAYTPKHRASLLSLHGGLSLISHLGKQKPEEADARLRRVSASFGVAAPLGCATLFVIWQCYCFFALHAGLPTRAR